MAIRGDGRRLRNLRLKSKRSQHLFSLASVAALARDLRQSRSCTCLKDGRRRIRAHYLTLFCLLAFLNSSASDILPLRGYFRPLARKKGNTNKKYRQKKIVRSFSPCCISRQLNDKSFFGFQLWQHYESLVSRTRNVHSERVQDFAVKRRRARDRFVCSEEGCVPRVASRR